MIKMPQGIREIDYAARAQEVRDRIAREEIEWRQSEHARVQKARFPGMPEWLPERAKPWEEEGLENPLPQPFLGPLPKAEPLGTAEKQYLDEWRAQGKNPAYGTREIKK